MGFKFFKQNIPDEPVEIRTVTLRDYPVVTGRFPEEYINRIEQTITQSRLTTDNRPAVFLNLNRNRDTISDEEWLHLLRQQRVLLIERMWEEGMIRHEVISQDEYGFTLRTEINF